MKLENKWEEKTVEQLEKKTWNSINKDEESYLVRQCHELRKKQIEKFTTEDLRIMIGQEIGLEFLIPKALQVLKKDLYAEGDFFEGDLLKNVLEINTIFWDNHKSYWLELNDLIKNEREKIKKLKFSTINFDNSINK